MRLYILILLFLGMGIAAVSARVDKTPVREPYREGNYIYFEGRAMADPTATGKTHSHALSKDAAVMDAMKKIALYIDGLKMKNGKTVKQAIDKDEKVRVRVDAFIKGAETVKMGWEGNGECRVVLKIDRKDLLESLKATEALSSNR